LVIERSFDWLFKQRRLTRYHVLYEPFDYIAFISMLTKRLTVGHWLAPTDNSTEKSTLLAQIRSTPGTCRDDGCGFNARKKEH